MKSILFKKYGRAFFNELKANVVEQQKSREKDQYKEKMWGKVNMWLGDMDKK